ncbi:unnamed protein product [Rotaria sp. Silwood2]|nr:unnamed protein product [Rotaria sp. Silwood2]
MRKSIVLKSRILPVEGIRNRFSNKIELVEKIYDANILFVIVAQYSIICPTAIWNNTFTVIAGITGVGGGGTALLNGPLDIFYTGNNTFYIADYYNNRIQKFADGSARATTVTNLTLSNPSSVHVTNNGDIYVLDTSNYRVVQWVNNVVTVVAGGRGSGSGLNQITTSHAMHVDANSNIYVSEYLNHRVTLWTAGNPNISQVVAGGYGVGSSSDKLNNPYGIYVDNSGTLFIADASNHRIQKWPSGAVVGTTVAGQTGASGSLSYQLNYPTHVMMDQYGYLYIMDANNNRIQKWFPGATYGVTVVSSSSMNDPRAIRFDPYGNIVVADHTSDRVISFAMLCPPNATTTVAPTPQPIIPVCQTAVWNQSFTVKAGSTGNAQSSETTLNTPHNIYIDTYGNLYVADCTNHRIQRFPRGSMFGTTVAGISASLGSSYSHLYYPTSIYVDPSNAMYILDWSNCRVLQWQLGDPLGFVVAGGHGCGGALTQIDNSYGLFVDSQSNIYISDYRNHRVVKWNPTNTTSGFLVAGGNGLGTTAERLNYPWGVYVDSNQGVYVVDHSNHRVQFWASGTTSGVTVAGMTSISGPWSYQFTNPTAITFDSNGYMYVLDTGNNRVQQWWPGAAYGKTVVAASLNSAYGLQIDHNAASTTTTTLPPTTPTTQLCATATWNATVNVRAGITGTIGTSTTLLRYPSNTYFDGYQNMYVVDTSNHRIQLFASGSYTSTTVAGNSGSAGSGYSELNNPSAIYVDANRIMYILDTANYRVLKWTLGEPLGYVVAGGQSWGSALTQISTSYGMFVDNQYNIWVSDSGNNRVTFWSVAGGNGAGSTPEKLNNPWGIYVDANQAAFIVDRNNHRVQRWDNGVLSGVTVAGTTGSSGPWSYQFSSPTAVMLDPAGFIYVLDSGNARIQKWWPGALYGATVFAASFATPLGMQLDRLNNLVVTDTNNHRIVSFGLLCPSTTSQICATAVWNEASSPLAGISGTLGSSTTQLYNPYDIAFDGYLNLYVADYTNHRIQLFSSESSIGTTVAGQSGAAGSGYSQLNNPSAIYIDARRTMYILDTSNYRVLKWAFGDPLGYVVAGGQSWGSALTQITTSYAMFVDNQGNVYVSEYGNHRVTLWLTTNTTTGILVAGGNGAGSTSQKLNSPWGIYVDVNSTIFIVDKANHRVQRWDSGALTGVTVAGSSGNGGPYAYQFNNPTGITFDQYGYMYVLDTGNSRVQRWFPEATYGVTVVATSMSTPYGIEVGPRGELIIADTGNHCILSFVMSCPPPSTTTTVPPTQGMTQVCATAAWNQAYTTIAGSMSTAGSTTTQLNSPSDIGFDGYQNMYVVDTNNHRIQRFPSGSNVGTTVAGVSGSAGNRLAELSSPSSIYVTSNQTMFILDTNNYRVLKWQVGNPFGYIVAGGQGLCSTFNCIGTSNSLFVDNQYNTYVSESSNNRVTIWQVTNTSVGQLVAGGNGAGNTADKLNSPWGIYVDVNGRIFVVDRNNHRVQRWDVGAAIGVTVAGSTSDPGPWAYQFSSPTAITLDQYGYIYVLDYNNDRVQKWVSGASFGITVVATNLGNPSGMRFDRQSNIVVTDTTNHRILSFGLTCPPATTTTIAPPTQAIVPLCATAMWNQSSSNLAGAMSTSGTTSTLLAYPYDIDFDGYRYMYVADRNNHRIQRFAPGSNIGVNVAGFSLGSGVSRSELYYPSAIAVSSNGTMFILDTYSFRVLKWQLGDALGYIVAGGHGQGSAYTQMDYSYGIFADDQYNIYLSEQVNCRVMFWSASNTSAGQLVAGGNGAGNTADKLNSPWGIYVNVNRSIFVVDRSNHRVQRWDLSAASGVTVAGSTSDPGPWSYQFSSPTAITLDQYGYIYVLDYNNNRVQKWWPGASYGTTIITAQFSNPTGMKIDHLGNIVVADASNHRVLSFPIACPAPTTTTTAPPFPTTSPLCATAAWNQSLSIVAGATSNAGSTSTLLNYPYYVAFDGYRNMYVVDYNNHRVQLYQEGSSTGRTVAGFSLSSGASRAELYYPVAIRVTHNQTMFILDRSNYRVFRWQVGDQLGYVIAGGHGVGAAFTQIGTSYDIFLDSQYNIYVSEYDNHRITLWSNGNTTAGRLVAGGNGAGSTADKLNGPWGIYVDASNTIYIVDRSNHRVQRWLFGASFGDTVAGSTSDAGPWSYQLSSPTTITMDIYGYIYIMDYSNTRVQKWWPGASYGSTVASAALGNAYGLALDLLGDIVVADTSNSRVVKFSLVCLATTTTTAAPATQPIIPLCPTAAWNQSFSIGAGATSAPGNTATLINSPYDIAFDGYDNMYVADFNNNRIQKFPYGSFVGSTVAGFTLTAGSTRAQLYYPTAIAVSPNGTMFIVDHYNFRVLKWQDEDPLGYVVAGGRGLGSTYDKLGYCAGIFVDEHYNVYVSDNSNNRVTIWYAGNTTAGVLVAGGNGVGSTADKLNGPWGVYVDVNGSIYIADRNNHRVQLWIAGGNAGITVAGTTGSVGTWSYQLSSPTAVTLDQYGNLYVLDQGNNRVQKWFPGATYGTTVISATMSSPYGMRIDRFGNMFITDTGYHRVLSFTLICPSSTTTTIAPPTQTTVPLCSTASWNSSFTTIAGAISNPGSTSTLFSSPYDMTFDGYQNMYVADNNNHRIQRLPAGSNIGQTVAGIAFTSGSGLSELSYPTAISVAPNGVMYILDSNNYRVLKWQLGDPLGALVVGGRGSGTALNQIALSNGMFVDNQYNVYVSETANNRVTKWFNGNTTAGILVAGGNGLGSTSDKLSGPWGIYVDSSNTLYVVDRGNHRVQKWISGAPLGVTVAGSTSDPGPWVYQFNNPTSITFDQYGYMYVLDQGNNRVQKWFPGAVYGTTIISATMSSPKGMQWDLLGNLVVADTSFHRIISFPVTCPSSTTTAAPPSTLPVVPMCATASWNQTYSLRAGSTSTTGTIATLFNSPYDVAFDAYENMYIVDSSNHRIQLFQPGSSNAITIAGSTGSPAAARSQLNTPYAIRVTATGVMYILDGANNRVLRWQAGNPVGYIVAGGQGSGAAYTQIGTSYALFLDSQYNIYVSESSNNRVTKWTAGNTTASILAAGGNGVGSTADKLNGPWGIYVDSSNAVFVVDRNNQRVQQWSYGSTIGITVAGTTGSSGPWSYQFSNPTAITFDIYGYMYVLDTGNNRVQKWFPGAIYGTTVISTTMSTPYGMTFDRLGNIFIADTSFHRILSFSLTCPATTTTPPPLPTQMAITLCPTATWNATFTQIAGGTAIASSTQYLLSSPYYVTVDAYQNVYVVDYGNHRIQRFPLGSIGGDTVAGVSAASGAGFSQLNNPTAIYVDSSGTMYILDSNNYRVLKWQDREPLGTVIVGGRGSGSTFDKIALSNGMFVDNQYNVYVSETANNRVTKWLNGNTTAGVLVAGGNGLGSTSDKLNGPWGIYVDSSNTVYVVDRGNHRVQQWVSGFTAGVTVAGSTNDPGPWSYQFNNPTTITFDPYGSMFVLDSGNNRVQKWWPGGSFGITVLSATLNGALGMTIDRAGNLYVADTGNQRIVLFSVWCATASTTTPTPPTSTTTLMCPIAVWNSNATIITGATAYSGYTPTFVFGPYGVNFDGYLNMYIADTGNHRIQQYSPNSNIGRTVAGVTNSSGTSLAQFNSPSAVAFDSNGIMYILDTFNYRVLKWTLGDTFGTVAVNGRGSGTTLDKIGVSYAMFIDYQNNIYVSEYGNHRVTKWIAGNNTIGELVAGISVQGSTADKLNYPYGIYVDASSVLYVADRSNHRIQKWPAGAAVGITIAGQSATPGAWSYQFNSPTAVIFDQYGYMYVMDAGNSRIQKWLPGMTYGVTIVTSSMGTPIGMNFDSSGNIVVADTSNNRIVSFNVMCRNATVVTLPPPTLPPNLACQTGVFNTSWIVAAGTSPTSGSGGAYLSSPIDVYVDGNQNIYVADSANSRIQKFPPAGTTIGPPTGNTVAGFTVTGGSGYSELNNPTAIFVDLNGVMYIADNGNYRIQKWLPNQPLGFTVAGGRGNGATFDKIGVVYAIFVDNVGNIYVSESSNNRVTLWYASNTTASQLIAGTGTAGTALNQLNAPWGVYVDLNAAVYISDRSNHRIVSWAAGAPAGVVIAGVTGSVGSTASLLSFPTAITLDDSNYLYVMDAGNNRVQRFSPGSLVADTIVSMGFSNPRGMRLDSISNIYIADMNYHRIDLFICVYNASTTTVTTTTTTSETTTSVTTTTTTSVTTTSGLSTTSVTTTSAITSATTSHIIVTTVSGPGGTTTSGAGGTTAAGGAGGTTAPGGGGGTTAAGGGGGSGTTAAGGSGTTAAGGGGGNTGSQSSNSESSQGSSNAGAIAGGVAGSIAAVGLVGVAAFTAKNLLLKGGTSAVQSAVTSKQSFPTKSSNMPSSQQLSNQPTNNTSGPSSQSRTGANGNSTLNGKPDGLSPSQIKVDNTFYNIHVIK